MEHPQFREGVQSGGEQLEDEDAHARVSKLGLERFYKRWNRCLTTMPKILLGEDIV